MKKLSRFDLGAIIAFVVVALLGGAAWWYLSGELQDAQGDVTQAKADFDKYSTKYDIVVSPSNGKILQANIDLFTEQLKPLIDAKLQPKENKLRSIEKEDPVAWKHDLDDDVHGLTASAKTHGVALPPNFYFGFARYLSQSPNDEQTAVLSKQLLGVDQIASILINAPVKAIQAIRRTYEEDPHSANNYGGGPAPEETDHLNGYALNAPGGVYTAYPFEVEFETNTENLRPILDSLLQSPYVFVVRSLSIENSNPNSPLLSDLDKFAPPPSSVVDTSPGEVAAAPPPLGPQFLFGNSTLKIKARIDMIEWTAEPLDAGPGPAGAQTKSPTNGLP